MGVEDDKRLRRDTRKVTLCTFLPGGDDQFNQFDQVGAGGTYLDFSGPRGQGWVERVAYNPGRT